MLKVEGTVIEANGELQEQLTDTALLMDYIFNELVEEFGTRGAERILRNLPREVIRKKRKERANE